MCPRNSIVSENIRGMYTNHVCTPADEAQAIIDAGVQVKANYKELLRQNWDTSPQMEAPPLLTSGDPADLQAYVVAYKAWYADRVAANAVASDAADAVNGFVPSWPVTFEVG